MILGYMYVDHKMLFSFEIWQDLGINYTAWFSKDV